MTVATSTKGRINAFIARIEHNAFGVIYGSVTVLALLMAAPHTEDEPLSTAFMLFGSVLAITLAKAFAQVSADAVHQRQPFGWEEIRSAWSHSAPTLLAANIPTLLIAGSATGLYTFTTSIWLAEIAAIGLLAVYGYSIGWVIYGRRIPGLLHAAFTSSIGIALSLMKFVIH